MYFLKCNNCGFLNEMKSEYQIFCSNCNKKLENNYADWQNRNPNKNFDDFKQLICVSNAELQNTPVKKKSKSHIYWIGYAVAIVVATSIFYAIGNFGGEQIVKFFQSEKTSKEVLGQKWIRESYGSFGLTVETPVKLTKGTLSFPDNVKQLIDQYDIYNYMSSKGFKVMINSIKYKPIAEQLNLQGAADGAINEVKMQKGVTDLDYTEESIFKKDIPGIIQKGTFKQDGIGIEFINAIFSKEMVLWQVLVAYQTDDEVGKIASKRVIESIEIKDITNIQ